MQKIRKGDEVIIVVGKDKGKQGKVIRVIMDNRLVVENINLVKRHTRPNPARNQSGGIVEKEMPLHISNVALFNPAINKADKVGFKCLADGRKVRYFKSNNEVIDS
jgi:large subunit ribosomal protein L24